MKNENHTCGACRFWDAEVTEYKDRSRAALNELGDVRAPCKRYAPMARSIPDVTGGALIEGNKTHSCWPETYLTDWCGEWQPIDGADTRKIADV